MQLGKFLFSMCVCCFLVYGSAAQAGYIDNGDGTVTDTETGLMWQQNTAPDTYSWKQALAYCKNLDFASYTDWRLPTAKELASLVDTSLYNPAINSTFFPGTVASAYWSSTWFNSENARYVDFKNGYVVWNYNYSQNYVRAVRMGQSGAFDNVTLWPVPDTGQTTCSASTCYQPWQAFYGQDACYSINTPAYTKLDSGCTALPVIATNWAMVRDAVTGLVWEEKHNMDGVQNYADPNDADNTYSWYDNNSAINGGNAGTPGDGTDTMDFIKALNEANYGGFADWRLPTVKELLTIVDYGEFDPAINIVYFPNTIQTMPYWSSTTFAGDTSSAWVVDFSVGGVGNGSKNYGSYVRAVRSGQCGSFGDLFISKSGTGSGTVISGAGGRINCGSDCTDAYTKGTEVTLTATPAFGSTFAGWSGGCTGTGSCTVTMNGKLVVTATFSAISCPAKKALGDNNPYLDNLRAFRDSTLFQSAIGRKMIQIYYNNADSINAALDRSPALKAFTRMGLEVIAPMVGREK